MHRADDDLALRAQSPQHAIATVDFDGLCKHLADWSDPKLRALDVPMQFEQKGRRPRTAEAGVVEVTIHVPRRQRLVVCKPGLLERPLRRGHV
jgi:hypothetical protein